MKTAEGDKLFYFAPRTVKKAIGLLDRYQENAKILAGGTDLLVQMKQNLLAPQYLVDIKPIKPLHVIKRDAKGIRIGPLVTHVEIETSKLIRRELDFLACACSQVGSAQVRNRGTIGGNLCNASPACDTGPCLLIAGASLTVAGSNGDHIVPIHRFFRGPSKTCLQPNEVLRGIFVPKLEDFSAGVYIKHTLRKAMDIAKVGVAVLVTRDPSDGRCKSCRIALGAVGPVPLRAREAEQIVVGTNLGEETIQEAARKASEEARPITDFRSSIEYRKEIIFVLTKRSLQAAWEKSLSSVPSPERKD